MNIPLNPDVEQFVIEKVKNGQYASAEQAVNTLLRQARQQEEWTPDEIAELRAAVDEGLSQANRGEFVQFNAEDVIAERHASRK